LTSAVASDIGSFPNRISKKRSFYDGDPAWTSQIESAPTSVPPGDSASTVDNLIPSAEQNKWSAVSPNYAGLVEDLVHDSTLEGVKEKDAEVSNLVAGENSDIPTGEHLVKR
jgi:hypothetical protein